MHEKRKILTPPGKSRHNFLLSPTPDHTSHSFQQSSSIEVINI